MLAGFFLAVDVAIGAVAFVSQFFQAIVLVVAHAESEHGEEDARLGFLGDQLLQARATAGAHVEVAVGAENHAVGSALDVVLSCYFVGQRDSCPAGSAAACIELGQCTENRIAVGCTGAREHHAGGPCVYHDGDPVTLVKTLGQHRHRLLDQRKLIRAVHAARDVQQEHEVARGTIGVGDFLALQCHPNQSMVSRPGAVRDGEMGGEGMIIALGWRCVLVVEVVDEFLDADRTRRRALTLVQEPTHVRIARGVHINTERRERIVHHSQERIFGQRIIRFPVPAATGISIRRRPFATRHFEAIGILASFRPVLKGVFNTPLRFQAVS